MIGMEIYFFVQINSQPVNSDSTIQNFVINQGDGLRSISLRLEKNNYIRNNLVFMFLSYRMGLNDHLQAGTFRLSSSMSIVEIIQKLATGGSTDYWFKIIDGQRVEELSIKFDKLNEGYLFPDSYLIPVSYTPNQILLLIKNNFDKKFQEAKISSQNNTLSDKEAVIMASLIEREARTLESKQMIAGIFYNRLKINMALELCSTAQYARDSKLPHPKTYWLPLAASDTHLKSDYNTYNIVGLPPSPICSPGYDSLYAVFHPLESDYLFFITGNDNKMHYAKTLEEHNANIAKYLK
jgi:UPF0755 protein